MEYLSKIDETESFSDASFKTDEDDSLKFLSADEKISYLNTLAAMSTKFNESYLFFYDKVHRFFKDSRLFQSIC